MRAKRWLTVMLAAALTVTLAACGDKKENAPGQTGDKEQEVALRVMWWGSQTRHDATLKAIELYQSQHPNVKIEAEYSGWDGYWDKLATLSAARNMPDVVQMDVSYLGDYSKRNQLLEWNGDLSKIDPQLLETGHLDGKQVALPAGRNSYGIVYNKALFTQYGLKEPETGWTWDDFFQLARDARDKLPEGVYLSRDFSAGELEYRAYQHSKGNGPFYIDNKLNMDKETWMEWSGIWSDFRKEGIVAPAEQTISDVELDTQFDSLVKGTILMRGTHSSQIAAYDSLMPDKLGIAAFPSADEPGGWLKPTFYWSINSGTKQAEEAQKFVLWLLNDEEAGKILKTERGTPVSDAVMTAIEPELTDADKLGQKMLEEVAKSAQPFTAQPPGYNDFGRDMNNTIQSVIFNKTTAEAAYDTIQKLASDTEANLN
ncbi:extracellular solute-binding protein [Paenibacillaceae bacterium]|nr:extracellular solute-binding protein [Paenibacillaceae bacterium]